MKHLVNYQIERTGADNMRKATQGISFGDIHSYDDLLLILSKKDIPPAVPKTTYIDIPGADDDLDLTEAHGEVKYKSRECSFTFTMHPYDRTDFEEKKTEISNLLNGREFKITLDTDPDYYYQGRCTVKDHLQNINLKQFVISAKVKAYKFKQDVTAITFALSETAKTVNLSNGRKSVCPMIECTNDNTVVVFGDVAFNLGAGIHKILDIQFKEGNNTLTVSGKGNITFRYQEGDL